MAHKILIVDDTQFMRKMLADCLTQNGYVVAGEAENGREAIQRYEELRPDLVMMDINMPEMGGIAAIAAILRLDPAAVILVCTAANQQDSIVEAMRAGAKGYVMKPFKTHRVLEIIRKYVDPHVAEQAAGEAAATAEQLSADDAPASASAPATASTSAPAAPEPFGMASIHAPLSEAFAAAAESGGHGQRADDTEVGGLPRGHMDDTEAGGHPEQQKCSAAQENSVQANSPRGNGWLNSFVSSVMCNWQEEVDGYTAAFTVVCTESENKVVIEMTGGSQPKQTMQFTLDGFRQLSGWLQEHVKTAS